MAYTPSDNNSYDQAPGEMTDWFDQNPPSTTAMTAPLVSPSTSVPVNTIGPGGVTVGGNATINPAAGAGNANLQDPATFVRNWFQQNGIQPGNETDGTTRKLVDAMKAAGYNVSYEQPDEYGRSSGIILNGVWTKVWDGSGNLIIKPFAEAEPGSPWQQGGAYTGGNMFGNSGMGGPFNPPSWESLKDYPGYQFAVDQGIRGIQNSAAAKGTLLTGGTMKDIVQFAGNSAAMPAYNNYFNQALQTHNTNFGNLFDMSQLGKPT